MLWPSQHQPLVLSQLDENEVIDSCLDSDQIDLDDDCTCFAIDWILGGCDDCSDRSWIRTSCSCLVVELDKKVAIGQHTDCRYVNEKLDKFEQIQKRSRSPIDMDDDHCSDTDQTPKCRPRREGSKKRWISFWTFYFLNKKTKRLIKQNWEENEWWSDDEASSFELLLYLLANKLLAMMMMTIKVNLHICTWIHISFWKTKGFKIKKKRKRKKGGNYVTFFRWRTKKNTKSKIIINNNSNNNDN